MDERTSPTAPSERPLPGPTRPMATGARRRARRPARADDPHDRALEPAVGTVARLQRGLRTGRHVPELPRRDARGARPDVGRDRVQQRVPGDHRPGPRPRPVHRRHDDGPRATATVEDIRFLQAMNRVRHAYHEAVPGLEPYFMSGHHDDLAGVLAGYGADIADVEPARDRPQLHDRPRDDRRDQRGAERRPRRHRDPARTTNGTLRWPSGSSASPRAGGRPLYMNGLISRTGQTMNARFPTPPETRGRRASRELAGDRRGPILTGISGSPGERGQGSEPRVATRNHARSSRRRSTWGSATRRAGVRALNRSARRGPAGACVAEGPTATSPGGAASRPCGTG